MTAVLDSVKLTDTSVWQRRRFASAALRVAVTLIPVVASVEMSLILSQELPAGSTSVVAVLRVVLIGVCSLLTLALTDAAARRFLPLAALLQLSLVFPDRTPSRFRTALRGGSGRRLAREVSQARHDGLSHDPNRAAEQLLILASAIGDHDRRTRGHSERVRLYTELIAEELHLPEDERWRLQWAALIHDIGKITVAPEILNKKGAPDAREWAILKRHPAAGAQLAAPVEPWLGDAIHAVGGHHERWDGGGYPNGLRAEEIPRSAAIVAVADAFEVMTAVRSYKKALPLSVARAELTRCAGTHFSPDVVRAMLSVSIGRLRSAMGLFAAVAHLPFLGQIAKAASYAPNTVSTAAGLTTSGATAGASVLALSGALALAPTASAAPIAPTPAPIVLDKADRSQFISEPASVGPVTAPAEATAPANTIPTEHMSHPSTTSSPTTVPPPAPPPAAPTAPVPPAATRQPPAVAPDVAAPVEPLVALTQPPATDPSHKANKTSSASAKPEKASKKHDDEKHPDTGKADGAERAADKVKDKNKSGKNG